jgi:dTDP-4-amino-4,6-dideoxygalactose transaminase
MLDGNTLCVVAHHLFGVPSDIERICALCRARGIFVVEDAAQAMGTELHGRKLGTLGDVGIFSFGRGKNITCGSGGAIVTNSSEIAAAVDAEYRRLPASSVWDAFRDFVQLVLMMIFIRPGLYWIPASLPFLRLGETTFPADVPLERLSALKAGLLHGWRNRLSRANRVRSETAAYFSRRLPLRLMQDKAHPYLRLPILAASPIEKRRLFSLSASRGLGLSVAYPSPLSDIPQMRAVLNGAQFPVARRVAERLLTIPTHEWLSERDKIAIADLWRDARTA